MPVAPAQRSTSLRAICLGAAGVQLIAAAVAVTMLSKLAMYYESAGRILPSATRFLLAGSGAPVWAVLLVLALALALAARFGSNRTRSIAILATAVVSGLLGLLVPILVLLPMMEK